MYIHTHIQYLHSKHRVVRCMIAVELCYAAAETWPLCVYDCCCCWQWCKSV